MSDNPLASRRPSAAEAKPDPMHRHAQVWQHIEQQPADTLHQHVAFMDYALPIIGRLAGNPDVKAKDVIKALSGAVADGKMDASKAVANLGDMPADPDKLRPWLREKYADALATTVHAKAALMRQGAMPPPGPAAPGAAPGPTTAALPVPATPGPTAAPPGATIQ
jgi:hypothetical protein